MQALETVGTIDKKGYLILSKPLELRNKVVKIIVLIADDDDTIENEQWLAALSTNPVYDFLKDDEEDIYTLSDGKPFQLS